MIFRKKKVFPTPTEDPRISLEREVQEGISRLIEIDNPVLPNFDQIAKGLEERHLERRWVSERIRTEQMRSRLYEADAKSFVQLAARRAELNELVAENQRLEGNSPESHLRMGMEVFSCLFERPQGLQSPEVKMILGEREQVLLQELLKQNPRNPAGVLTLVKAAMPYLEKYPYRFESCIPNAETRIYAQNMTSGTNPFWRHA